MSYLIRHARLRPAPTVTRTRRHGPWVDERTLLNLPDFCGGAHVRVFVENTSHTRVRRRRLPSPHLKLRITDCVNQINLEFSVDSFEARENSIHKVNTLIGALERFRAGLAEEARLREDREQARSGKEARCRT